MQSKTTRAFRTISEAADELDLQPHVLRFWESKFSQIRPIKRAGGRRLYRPEDIDLLRGIKILLHEEKHPIKDVQKIIRIKGPSQVVDLGRTVKRAARPKDVTDTVLIPERIVGKSLKEPVAQTPEPVVSSVSAPPMPEQKQEFISEPTQSQTFKAPETIAPALDISRLKTILSRLTLLRQQWDDIDLKTGQ